MFKVNSKDTKTTPYSTPCSFVSIVDFEHVIAGWVSSCYMMGSWFLINFNLV